MADTDSHRGPAPASLMAGRYGPGKREKPVRVRGSRARTGARTEWRTAWHRLSRPHTHRRRTRLRTLIDTGAAAGGASADAFTGPTAGPGPAEDAHQGLPGRRVARWVPAILILGGVSFDLATPSGYTASPFFAAAPLVAAALLPLRQTVVMAVIAVLTTCLLAELHGVTDPTQAATEIVTVATVTVLAVAINRVVRRSYHRLASARGVAEAAQRAVLPAPPARLAGLEIAARYVPAEKYAAIGGDLYAVQDTPHGVRLTVGDVRGKGLGAVEVVAILLGCFREAAEQETTLEALVGRLERALQREGARRADLEVFEGSRRRWWPKFRVATPLCDCSTAAIRRRCSWRRTERCAPWSRRRRRCRWGWGSWPGGRTG
ncbi:hypothetical protein SANT12839_052280 [Streptomyces antimycoticus]|uniref:PPM-type phosphatase domain-containing protein n=1 Tax=Streptomyces antimycoticus TaxID=68175 RepID=A0A4D4KC87_9ACTN|nr:hypothetical protein SANT12839_052280 [Streptomyces antimycoticus]